MRLIDCYLEALATTTELVTQLQANPAISYDEVRIPIDRAIADHAMDYTHGGFAEAHYRDALFAVVAYIDEAILATNWSHKDQWQKSLLQFKHFNTVNAGKEFYDRLSELSPINPASRDIREVFYYCLTLGFKGKFFAVDSQAELEALKASNLQLLAGNFDVLKEQVVPEGYAAARQGGGVRVHRSMTAFYVGLPVIVIVVLFFVYKSSLLDAAEYFIRNI